MAGTPASSQNSTGLCYISQQRGFYREARGIAVTDYTQKCAAASQPILTFPFLLHEYSAVLYSCSYLMASVSFLLSCLSHDGALMARAELFNHPTPSLLKLLFFFLGTDKLIMLLCHV